MLTGEPNLSRAARQIRELGPRALLVKQGRYGACMFTDGGFFSIPGLPARIGDRPDGRGRLVRRRLLRLPRLARLAEISDKRSPLRRRCTAP